MSTKNNPAKYTEEFKKTIVSLYQSGKTYAQIQKEYGVSSSALSNWVRKYSQVKVDDDTILSARHTQTETERHRHPVRSAFRLHPLPGAAPTTSPCGISPPAGSRRMWRFGSGYWHFTPGPTNGWVRRR